MDGGELPPDNGSGNYNEFVRLELVAYDVPAVAARRRTGSITGRDWA